MKMISFGSKVLVWTLVCANSPVFISKLRKNLNPKSFTQLSSLSIDKIIETMYNMWTQRTGIPRMFIGWKAAMERIGWENLPSMNQICKETLALHLTVIENRSRNTRQMRLEDLYFLNFESRNPKTRNIEFIFRFMDNIHFKGDGIRCKGNGEEYKFLLTMLTYFDKKQPEKDTRKILDEIYEEERERFRWLQKMKKKKPMTIVYA